MGTIQLYEAARRDMLVLWRAKQRLFQAAQSRFPSSRHPVFKMISKLCHNDATCQIRHLCDVAICKCADIYGDDVFRNYELDGVRMPAVTHWYYGLYHLLPIEKVALSTENRTKIASDLELLEEVYRLGRKFTDNASSVLFFYPLRYIPLSIDWENKLFLPLWNPSTFQW